MSYLNNSHKTAYLNLQSQLAKATAKLTPSLKIDESGAFPVLMYESELEVAGFGILQQDAQKEYASSYGEFRKIYSANRKRWSRSNVSFVVCRPDEILASSEFLFGIESDIYFCRKYVISVGERIAHEIERLPFVPLDRESIAAPRRPVSAQSLLQNLGANPELAKSIASPGYKTGTKIASECAQSTSFVCPENLDEAAVYFKSAVETKPYSRMKSITINDFRAYRGKHVFNLDADLVVLYGPNGLGKTSFFDAVDFVSTAGCGRFREIGGDDSFLESAPHLDAEPEDSFVELETTSGSASKKFLRHVSNAKKVSINGTLKDRTPALRELTGLGPKEFENRVETITNLFRATHLFGQDFQTLTEGFGKTSELSLDIVSRMLAFQDYARSDQKIGEVVDALKSEQQQLAENIEVSKTRADEVREQLEKLQVAAIPMDTPDSLEGWLEGIVALVATKVTIPPKSEDEETRQYLRTVRSVIEAVLRRENSNAKTLSSLIDNFEPFNLALSQLKAIEEKLDLLNRETAESIGPLQDLKKNISEKETALSSLKIREGSARKSLEDLLWLKPAIIRIQTLRQTLQEHIQLRSSKESDRDLLEQNLISAEKLVSEHKLKLDTIQKDLSESTNFLKELSEIRLGHESYAILAQELEAKTIALSPLDQEKQSLLESIEEEKKNLKLKTSNRELLIEARDLLLKQETQLSSIIERLKAHVVDGHCPACGVDHGDRNAVIALLSSQSATKSKDVQIKGQEIDVLSGEILNLEKSMSEKSARIRILEAEALQIRSRLSFISASHESFRQRISKVGILLDANDVSEKLTSLAESTQKQAAGYQLKLAELNIAYNSEKASADSIRVQIENLREDIEGLATKIIVSEREVQDKLTQVASRGFDFNTITPLIEQKVAEANLNLEESRKLVSQCEGEINDLRLTLAAAVEREAQSNQQKTALLKEKQTLQTPIETFQERLKNLALPNDTNFDFLNSKKNELETRLTELRDILSQVSTAEIAIDSAELSAEIARLSGELKKIETEMDGTDAKRTHVESWIKTFNALKKFLTEVRDGSISEYTSKYGPLASTIQSRLRSVYGFGEISLESSQGKIAVTVKRSDEQLRPIDYFSESQKQILVLSIFLASAITQNWSSFSPVFLDDPVTHFDDLNAYAFLDLVSGMLQSERGRRQFVISTCEEKLFQLMRQKFYGYGGRVIIYEFTGIGANGPVWSQLPNGTVTTDIH